MWTAQSKGPPLTGSLGSAEPARDPFLREVLVTFLRVRVAIGDASYLAHECAQNLWTVENLLAEIAVPTSLSPCRGGGASMLIGPT